MIYRRYTSFLVSYTPGQGNSHISNRMMYDQYYSDIGSLGPASAHYNTTLSGSFQPHQEATSEAYQGGESNNDQCSPQPLHIVPTMRRNPLSRFVSAVRNMPFTHLSGTSGPNNAVTSSNTLNIQPQRSSLRETLCNEGY